jgi:hypothetical protein
MNHNNQNEQAFEAQEGRLPPLTLADLIISEPSQEKKEEREDNNDQDPTTTTTTIPNHNTYNSSAVLPSPASLPRVATKTYRINTIPTYMLVQIFANRIVVGISQLPNGTFGHFVLVQVVPNETNPKQVDYQITPLLGVSTMGTTKGDSHNNNEALLSVYAHRITERIHTLLSQSKNPAVATSLTVVLGMSFPPKQSQQQPQSPKVFHTIIDLLVNLYQSTAYL